MSKKIAIIENKIRLEFEGYIGPNRIVIPIRLDKGKHEDEKIIIRPRNGICLKNSISIGDSLQNSFTKGRATSAGGSFFATASHTSNFSKSGKGYEVYSLPDFSGIVFSIVNCKIEEDSIGILLEVYIDKYEPDFTSNYFAEVILAVNGETKQSVSISREVHPCAGKVLLLSGYSTNLHRKIFGRDIEKPKFAQKDYPLMIFSDIQFPTIENLRTISALDYDIIHFFTNINGSTILINDKEEDAENIFSQLNGLNFKLLYIDTCNSVQVISYYRGTDINALIAATQNLYQDYGDEFNELFYQSLGVGKCLSESFGNATKLTDRMAMSNSVRSGKYNPMFLDLKSDFSFKIKEK